MSNLSGLRYFHMCWLAKPSADRMVYKLIKRHAVKSIVEIGLGEGQRCEKMIRVAQKFSDGEVIRYTGIDHFEDRKSGQTRLSLLEMHKRLNKTGAKVKVVPGDAESATARVANSLAGTDLIVLTITNSLDELDRFWFYLPRMVHEQSRLLVQVVGEKSEKFRILTQKDWIRWTQVTGKAAKAA